MIRGVSLAGHVASWVFPGSRSLIRRLEQRPWLERGDALLIRVSGTEAATIIARFIEETIHGLDQRASAPRIETTLLETSLEQALFGAAGEGVLSVREMLRRELDEAPSIRVVVTLENSIAGATHSDAKRLVELASKLADRYYLVVITVLASRAGALPDEAMDLGTGLPSGGVLASKDDGHVALWQAYLHTRAAWECGGDLDAALALGDTLDLKRGDDRALEMQLAANAQRLATEPAVAQCLTQFTDALSGGVRLTDQSQDVVDEFLERGLMWQPPGSVVARPTPWVARWLLVRHQAPRIRPYLRAALACLPLSAEILGVCLQLEGVIRERWSQTLEGVTWDYDDLAAWRRYRDGLSNAFIYPEGYPSPPDEVTDAVSFVSFGRTLARARDSQRSLVPQFVEDLVDLRNALAHGHYATWRHVDAASRCLENTARW